MSHQRLGASAGSEPYLDTARRVGRGEKGFRPGCVVAVAKSLLRPIDRQSLSIGCEPEPCHQQTKRLFPGTLSKCRTTARLRANQQSKCIEGCVASHADCRFQF